MIGITQAGRTLNADRFLFYAPSPDVGDMNTIANPLIRILPILTVCERGPGSDGLGRNRLCSDRHATRS